MDDLPTPLDPPGNQGAGPARPDRGRRVRRDPGRGARQPVTAAAGRPGVVCQRAGSVRRGHAASAARQLRRAAALDPPAFRSASRSPLPWRRRTSRGGPPDPARGPRRGARERGRQSCARSPPGGARRHRRHDQCLSRRIRQPVAPDQAPNRYQVRVELVRYLLAHEQRSRALSELLIVSADMPDTAAAHAELGSLFLEASEPGRALTQLERSRALDPPNQAVALAAGRAAFALGEDPVALRHLRAAPDSGRRATWRPPSRSSCRTTRCCHGCPPPSGNAVSAAGWAGPAAAGAVHAGSPRRRRCVAALVLRSNWIDSRRRSRRDASARRSSTQLDDGVELIARIELRRRAASADPAGPGAGR